MKKFFCAIFFIYFLNLTFIGNNASAIETNDGAYHADQIFLEKAQHPQVESDTEIEKSKKFQKDKPFGSFESSLMENHMDDDDDEPLFQQLKDVEGEIDERPLHKKLLEKGIIRTDIPTYLLDEELTFAVSEGPISKIQFYGAYRGSVYSYWNAGDYDTGYNSNTIQVGAMGQFRNSNNEFKISINPKGSSDRGYMQNLLADAYIVNNSIPHHQVIIGNSRNQVGKEGGSGSYILPFIMRSQLARNFGSTRALGVRVVGNYDLVNYSLAFNSSDRYFKKWFAGPEFTGWVDFKPLGKTDGKYGKLVIGSGLNTGKNGTNYTVGSFYVGYKYKKLWSRFEYGIADGYNGSQTVDKKAEGFYGIIGYKITPKVQIIGRYDQFNPDRNISGDTRKEYTAGINYFIKGQALKLILNYVFCDNGNYHDSHRIMVGTQILL